MTILNLQIPAVGQANSTEEPKIASDLTAISTWANGTIDASNISAGLAQSAGVNQSGQTAKGVSVIPASESTSSTTYIKLATPDQVTGIVLPANGLIAVWYQATWYSSAPSAGYAAIFLGSNQLKVATADTSPTGQAALCNPGTTFAVTSLTTGPQGLQSGASVVSSYTGDVTTGQVVGNISGAAPYPGGPCYIFAAAGTYTVSVQFLASTGSVVVTGRKLWVQALGFG